MSDLVRMSENHRYKTSKDYEHLFDLMQKTEVVCIVDYLSCRDIASTLLSGKMFSVSARGISYISAFTKEQFIGQCAQYNLEYIKPELSVEKITDTERLDFILKHFIIDDIGDDISVPAVCVDYENLCEELTWGPDNGRGEYPSLCDYKDDIRVVIDRAIKAHGVK